MGKRFFIGVGAAMVLGAALLAAVRTTDAQQHPAPAAQEPAEKSDLRGPKQPVFFRHDVHAGQLKMQCQYCHYSVQTSPEPGIPSMQTCMGCHALVSGTTPENRTEITKLKNRWKLQKPIAWVRVHAVARHVHFPHQRHIKALGNNACATCHGNVARMPQVYKVNNVNNMGFCINCHIERKVSRDCSVCHY